MGFVGEAIVSTNPPVPPFIKNKLSQCVSLVAKIYFPDKWPLFLRDFLALLSTGNPTNAAEMFCRVLDAVDETIVCGAFGGAFDNQCASRVKDAMRNDRDALSQLTEAWRQLIICSDAKVAIAATSTAMRYVDWMDVTLFTSAQSAQMSAQTQSIADAARVSLTAEDADRRAAGCSFFAALVAKGMDHFTKVELITGLRLVETCAHLHQTATAEQDDDANVCAAQLTAAVGHELLACLRAGDVAHGADQTEPHAASPPVVTLQQAATLTDTLMPTAVNHLRSEDERAVAAALPLCSAYVLRLKDPSTSGKGTGTPKGQEQSRDTGGFGFGDGGGVVFGGLGVGGGQAVGGPVCVNPETARGALSAIAQACVSRGAFPDERRAGVDFNSGQDPRVKEAEAETQECRRDLGVLFRAVARVAPPIALDAVRSALVAALPTTTETLSGSYKKPTWQAVEAVVAAVHLLGEGANDPAVKPGSDGLTNVTDMVSPLGELFEFVVHRWNGETQGQITSLEQAACRPDLNPSATHRLVAPVFLETCARYHLAVARNPDKLLLPILAAFLDQRGARHPDPEVAARACYLFSKIVKPLRQQIVYCLPDILRAMEEIVVGSVEPLQITPPPTTSNTQTLNKGTGGAMATVGNDDRLYVYEALGYLLGTEDIKLPEETQVEFTEGFCLGLRQRLERATHENDASTAARVIVAMANIAKGFSVRLATEIRPRLGEALVAGLQQATSSLSHFDSQNDPSAHLIRQRTVAYFQRMVQGVGERAFAYAAPLIDRIAKNGSKKDLKECFVLCNQLAATFKEKLAPFVLQVTPGLTEQTFQALQPFCSPDGRLHGVLGLVRSIADVPNVLATVDKALATNPATPDTEKEQQALRNTEDSREARELEVMYVAHVHALAANNLINCLAGGQGKTVNIESQHTVNQTRETVLATLATTASAHQSATSRKAAMQAFLKIAQYWFPTVGQTTEPVPGFSQFASEVIVSECCCACVLRGDLDVRDAAGAAAVGECLAFQRLAIERLGTQFANQLRDGVLVNSLGLDPSLANEYIAAVTSTAQTTHRDARAVVARCQKVVQGARPGLLKRPCKR